MGGQDIDLKQLTAEASQWREFETNGLDPGHRRSFLQHCFQAAPGLRCSFVVLCLCLQRRSLQCLDAVSILDEMFHIRSRALKRSLGRGYVSGQNGSNRIPQAFEDQARVVHVYGLKARPVQNRVLQARYGRFVRRVLDHGIGGQLKQAGQVTKGGDVHSLRGISMAGSFRNNWARIVPS